MEFHPRGAERTASHRVLAFSLSTVVLLAAIAAIRVPLHDLGIVQEGSIVAGLLVFVPLAIWVAVALRRRVPNPLLTLTAVGFAFAVMLAIMHQLFWGAAFGGPCRTSAATWRAYSPPAWRRPFSVSPPPSAAW